MQVIGVRRGYTLDLFLSLGLDYRGHECYCGIGIEP